MRAEEAAAKSAFRKSGVENRNEYQFLSVIAIFFVSFHARDTRPAYNNHPKKPKHTRPQLDHPSTRLIVSPPSSPLKIEGITLA